MDGVIGSLELKNQQLPSKKDEKWQYGGKVQNIHIYPIKSCGAISVTSANVKKFGLEYEHMKDRQFLIVDQKHNLITGRMQPKLVLIQPWIQNETLTINGPGMESFKLKIPTTSEGYEAVKTSVFGKSCSGIDLGKDVGQWISTFLGKPQKVFKLIYHIETNSTRDFWNDKDPFTPLLRKDDIPLYADDGPIMLSTMASFEAMNAALEAKNVAKLEDYKQFRPCIVVNGRY